MTSLGSYLPEEGDGVSQHEDEEQHGVQVQADPAGPGHHHQDVGPGAVPVAEVGEEVEPLGGEGGVGEQEQGQEEDEVAVDGPVVAQVELGLLLPPPRGLLVRRAAPPGDAVGQAVGQAGVAGQLALKVLGGKSLRKIIRMSQYQYGGQELSPLSSLPPPV